MFSKRPRRRAPQGYREGPSSSHEAGNTPDLDDNSSVCTSLAPRNSLRVMQDYISSRQENAHLSDEIVNRIRNDVVRLQTIIVSQEIRIADLEKKYNALANSASAVAHSPSFNRSNSNYAPSSSHAAKHRHSRHI